MEINQLATTLTASSVTVNAGGQIALNNGSVLSNAVTLAGGTVTARSTGTGIFNGAVSVTANSAVDLRSYTDLTQDLDVTIGGILSGSAALNINGNATGGKALILTNTGNTFSGNYNIGAGQTLRSLPASTGKTLGTGTINLLGGTLQVRDNGTGNLTYGNNVVVGAGGGSINTDRISGAVTGSVLQLNTLTIGSQTLNLSSGNNYRVRFLGTTTLTGAANLNVGSGGTTSMTVFMNAAIGGTGSLTKSGVGILRLQAANTYSGDTNVNGGTLILAAAATVDSSPRINIASGAVFDGSAVTGGFKLAGTQTLGGGGNVVGTVTALNGSTLQPGGATGIGTLVIPTLTFGQIAGDANAINFASIVNSPKLNITNTGGLVASGGANSVTLNIGGAAPTPPNTYTLIDYTGTLGGGGFAAFRLGSIPARVISATLVDNAANTSIDLNVTAIDFPIWKGALSSEWTSTTQAAPKNWVLNSNNSTGTDFLVDDNANFTDLATQTNVNIGTTDVSPGSLVFTNATKNYTITGSKAITGIAGLTKSGAGKVTISNTNSFLGPVTLNGGTLSVSTLGNSGVASGLGAGSSISINGGTLEYTGAAASTNRTISIGVAGGTLKMTNSLTLTGTFTGSGTLTIGGGTLEVPSLGTFTNIVTNGTLRLNQSGALTLSALLSGTGGVSIVGGGTVTLGGTASTYTGVTEVSNATLIAAKAAGVTAIPGDLVINTGGIFRYVNNNVSNQIADTASIVINGGTFGDPLATTPTNPGATDTVANVTVNGGIFGSGRNVTIGPFTVTGTLHVLGGGIAIAQRGGIISAAAAQIGDGSVNLDGGSGTAANESRLDVGAGGLTLASGTINFNVGISGLGGGSVGSIVRLGGDIVSTGISQLIRQNPGISNATLNLQGGTRVFNVTGKLDIGAPGAPIDITNGSIQKTGSGTLTITGTQNYTSLTADGGTTTLNTSLGTGAGTITANATVDFESDQVLATLDIGPGGIVNLGGVAPALGPEMNEALMAAGSVPVPEPGSWSLLWFGGCAAMMRRYRR